MALTVRRVVTGFDPDGKPVVKLDGTMGNVTSRRPGQSECEIWSTDPTLAPGDVAEAAALKSADRGIATGTVFRIVDYAPGVAAFPHKNDWIDYTIVIAGEIDMAVADAEVHLKAGDVVVQRGTVHNWINRGTAHCTLAFVRVGARPEP